MLVTLSGKALDVSGLLLDFKELKTILRPTVDYLDHQMINELEPFTVVNPSAENLAAFFFEHVDGHVASVSGGRVHVAYCTIYETDTSAATFRRSAHE